MSYGLTYDAYNETVEEKQQKDDDLQLVKERMASIENVLVAIQPLLQNIKPEMLSYYKLSKTSARYVIPQVVIIMPQQS